jgi:DNA polymerase III delta subunit
MKIDPSQLDWRLFFQKPPELVLLYGSDKGLIRFFLEDCRKTLKKSPFLLKIVQEEIFWEDPHSFFQSDLFSEKGASSIVVLEEVSDKNAKRYHSFLDSGIKGSLILTSLKMRAASSLVQEAQKSPGQWAVACYPLGLPEKGLIIQKKAHTLGIRFSKEALQMISIAIDLEDLSATLEKLSLWGDSEVCSETLESCLGQGNFLFEGDLAYILSGRQEVPFQKWMAQAKTEDVLQGLRQAGRHFMNLLCVQSGLHSQRPLDESLAELSPPIFFKQLPLFKAHLRQWSLAQLLVSLSLLARAELLLKKRPFDRGYIFLLQQIMQ